MRFSNKNDCLKTEEQLFTAQLKMDAKHPGSLFKKNHMKKVVFCVDTPV